MSHDPRLAKALIQLRSQINAKWPNRSKLSDGWIGDAAHAARKSDHNPNAEGVVTAIDVTHDPANGLNANELAKMLINRDDSRLEYVISNGQIAYATDRKWRHYTGSNPHTHHCHISVLNTAKDYDDAKRWDIGGVGIAPDPAAKKALPVLRKGAKSREVGVLQRALHIDDDWDFGPKTERAVIKLQTDKGLLVDGIAGPQVWEALGITEV